MKQEINYIGVFLTFKCKMGCDYCLNKQGDFKPRKSLHFEGWVKILKDLPTRDDLPISLQGGEPTMYKGFYPLVRSLYCHGKKIDLLTNGDFDAEEFIKETMPVMFKRPAPYASIRFSFHKNTNELKLLDTVTQLYGAGYSVGIWGIDHPDMRERNKWMRQYCGKIGLDYREKEYLDDKHGTYKYPDAVTGWRNKKVLCYPSEMLFAPDGKLFNCHYALYANKNIPQEVSRLGAYTCPYYGLCNPCDIKLKTNRLQEGGHCSVEIEEIV